MKKSAPTGIAPTRIAVDIGGTFTDIALDNGNTLYTAKTLTTQDDPVRGVIDVIRIASSNAGCTAQSIGSVIHGTTLATNALIERKGAQVGLITTAGFRDIIEIAYERRYDQYDIFIDKPMPQWGNSDLLAEIDFDNIHYYIKPKGEQARDWDDVPEGIKKTIDRLGIPEAEQKVFLMPSGTSSQSRACSPLGLM